MVWGGYEVTVCARKPCFFLPANNALTELPASFLELSSLRVLFFLNNNFAHVPSLLGRSRSLFMLSFKGNNLVRAVHVCVCVRASVSVCVHASMSVCVCVRACKCV